MQSEYLKGIYVSPEPIYGVWITSNGACWYLTQAVQHGASLIRMVYLGLNQAVRPYLKSQSSTTKMPQKLIDPIDWYQSGPGPVCQVATTPNDTRSS